MAQRRTVSWETSIPRSSSISSTIRRLSGKRAWSQTAWAMTSRGKRCRRKSVLIVTRASAYGRTAPAATAARST